MAANALRTGTSIISTRRCRGYSHNPSIARTNIPNKNGDAPSSYLFALSSRRNEVASSRPQRELVVPAEDDEEEQDRRHDLQSADRHESRAHSSLMRQASAQETPENRRQVA